MSPDQYLHGRANWPGFKERFPQLMASKGFKEIITGALKCPTVDPVYSLIETETDSTGAVIRTVTKTSPVKSTQPGSMEPLIIEWIKWDATATAYMFQCIVDPDLYGLKLTDSSFVNWTRLNARLNGKDIAIQIAAEDKFTKFVWSFKFDNKHEWSNFKSAFTAVKKAAIEAGVQITDGLAKGRFITVVTKDRELKNAALAVPATATLDEAITIVESRWIHEWNEMKGKVADEMKVKAMQASRGNGGGHGSQICTNPIHGSGYKSNHKTEDCWAPGGANIANRPPRFKKAAPVAPTAPASILPAPTPSVSNVVAANRKLRPFNPESPKNHLS
ncbi:hypothetical protein C8J56DRAFT_894254 [Mycena floridula]|nr:hypothetical protein C8J56DRAFT_894254 [Mycena floridula]